MPQRASVLAQAKINLSLHVLARESTGYHQIETVFCRLELGDTVRIRPSATRSLDCSGPAMPPSGLGPTEQNLAWRAALAFGEATPSLKGFAIEIEKRIPVGGGLGGGSADAGAVLRGLNALSARPLTVGQLVELAAVVGADVPFLTQDTSPLALAWGRGDRLLTLPPLVPRHCVLVTAPFGVSTAAAYGWIAERGERMGRAVNLQPSDFATWQAVDSRSGNDFEAVVFPRVPHLGAVHRLLAERFADGQYVVRMSGTGSTLYALLDPVVGDGATPPVALPEGFALVPTRTAASVAPVVLSE